MSGAIFAYLRPRVVLVLGSLGALVFTGVQAWVLWNQNVILRQQNLVMEAQTDAADVQAISFMLSSLDPENSLQNEVAITQLGEFGERGYPVLVDLVRSTVFASSTPFSTELAESALRALFGQASSHSPEQVSEVIQLAFNFAGILHVINENEPLLSPVLRHEQLGIAADAVGEYFRTIDGRLADDPVFRDAVVELLARPEYVLGLFHNLVASPGGFSAFEERLHIRLGLTLWGTAPTQARSPESKGWNAPELKELVTASEYLCRDLYPLTIDRLDQSEMLSEVAAIEAARFSEYLDGWFGDYFVELPRLLVRGVVLRGQGNILESELASFRESFGHLLDESRLELGNACGFIVGGP